MNSKILKSAERWAGLEGFLIGRLSGVMNNSGKKDSGFRLRFWLLITPGSWLERGLKLCFWFPTVPGSRLRPVLDYARTDKWRPLRVSSSVVENRARHSDPTPSGPDNHLNTTGYKHLNPADSPFLKFTHVTFTGNPARNHVERHQYL